MPTDDHRTPEQIEEDQELADGVFKAFYARDPEVIAMAARDLELSKRGVCTCAEYGIDGTRHHSLPSGRTFRLHLGPLHSDAHPCNNHLNNYLSSPKAFTEVGKGMDANTSN